MDYLWIKALHIIAVISWLAGMLYLPRLFVYHANLLKGSEASELLKIMEYRLLKYIINPAMIVTWVFGICLIYINGLESLVKQGWFHAKITLLILMMIVHIMLAKYRRNFANDNNVKSANFFRVLNEVPTALMIGIVILVVVKPF
jgi:protoporphyrinogen IX oxidase